MTLHWDESRERSLAVLRQKLSENNNYLQKSVLIDDLAGLSHLLVFAEHQIDESIISDITQSMKGVLLQYWSGEIWQCIDKGSNKTNPVDKNLYQRAWDQAIPDTESPAMLRILDRHRNREAWFARPGPPIWELSNGSHSSSPPIILFYSFKGGVGRTTALASFAIQKARAGEAVVVIDADLDAPGVGTLLASDTEGNTSPWGIIDYLLEQPITEDISLNEYYHVCRREEVTGQGEIIVFPAGTLDALYLDKLARVDIETSNVNDEDHPFLSLLRQIKEELRPDWILIDSRAGLADPAGLFLGNTAHLNVLVSTSSEQSWKGLKLILNKLGASRIHQNLPQASCLLIHAMVPRDPRVSAVATTEFKERAESEFTEHYYLASEDIQDSEEERFWTVDDIQSSDAPHVPIPIPYDEVLARFSSIDTVANTLAEGEAYKRINDRVSELYASESSEEN